MELVAYVEALMREREGYVRMGKDSRVAAVDAELTRLGAGPPIEPAIEPAVEPDEPVVSRKRPRRERAVQPAPEQAIDKEPDDVH